jgi:AraC-like DNA-binding protein
MSRTAFAIRFSLLLGESPMRYVTRRRIARAVALLESSHMAVVQIAREAGYESEVSFSKAFKRHVGLSPAAYRQGRPRRFGNKRAAHQMRVPHEDATGH